MEGQGENRFRLPAALSYPDQFITIALNFLELLRVPIMNHILRCDELKNLRAAYASDYTGKRTNWEGHGN
ncbi:MAG: hypothetical protein Kow0042_29260 [Calditrichia bacterium]